MATTSPLQLYPLSSQSGQSIPLDAIKPILTWVEDLVNNAVTILPETAADTIWVLYCTQPALVSLSANTLTAPAGDGDEFTECVFIPAHTQMTLVSKGGIGKAVSMGTGSGAGRLFATQVERWSGLGTLKQSSFR